MEQTKSEPKPIHAKPQLYAYYFLALKEIAKDFGYNLVVHGSMNRDLDLVAIPWVDDLKPEALMIEAMVEYLGGSIQQRDGEPNILLPGGRKAYVLNLNRGGYKRNEKGEIAHPIDYTPDPQYYIDISVTPHVKILSHGKDSR